MNAGALSDVPETTAAAVILDGLRVASALLIPRNAYEGHPESHAGTSLTGRRRSLRPRDRAAAWCLMARRSRIADSGHTILVVDDQEETLSSVRHLLEREGHRVVTASSGEEALHVLDRTDVQVTIVDYFMPRMTGGELVERVRCVDQFVQIILQTGYAGEKPPRVMLEELDIQGYHDKTDDPERLLLWVNVALRTHRFVTELRERERLQGELVANCSHELRTPLNVIGGYTELLAGGELGAMPADAVGPLRAVQKATRELTDLVSDFLSYAKVQSGAAPPTHERIETATLVRELQRLGQLLAEDKDIRFELDVAAAPEWFVSDAGKVRTILRNLVTNAAKFTAAGTIALEIACVAGALRIAVRDTGPGIRAEDLEHIFEPFRQGDGSSTRRHGGLGLGLALSRRLARLLGGTLEVESRVGTGSTFTLVLPAASTVEPARDRSATGRDEKPTAAAV
jgi:signal transduction histidine kinase